MGGSNSTFDNNNPPVYIKFYTGHGPYVRFASIIYDDPKDLERVPMYDNALRVINRRKENDLTRIVISHDQAFIPNPAAIATIKRLWPNQMEIMSRLPKITIDELVLDLHFPFLTDWTVYKAQFTASIKALAAALNIRIPVVKATWSHYGGDADPEMQAYAKELQAELNQ